MWRRKQETTVQPDTAPEVSAPDPASPEFWAPFTDATQAPSAARTQDDRVASGSPTLSNPQPNPPRASFAPRGPGYPGFPGAAAPRTAPAAARPEPDPRVTFDATVAAAASAAATQSPNKPFDPVVAIAAAHLQEVVDARSAARTRLLDIDGRGSWPTDPGEEKAFVRGLRRKAHPDFRNGDRSLWDEVETLLAEAQPGAR